MSDPSGTTGVPSSTAPGGGLLGYATDAECIAACLKHIGHLELVMRECCDAIRDNDEFGALRMLEVALKEPHVGNPRDSEGN
jgi:hypothetical protein